VLDDEERHGRLWLPVVLVCCVRLVHPREQIVVGALRQSELLVAHAQDGAAPALDQVEARLVVDVGHVRDVDALRLVFLLLHLEHVRVEMLLHALVGWSHDTQSGER